MSSAHVLTPDVVVVGGGAIGAASAYELTRRGARVTVLERSGDATGCSFGNAGLICPSHAEALASLAAVRDGLGFMTRRDSPFRIRPRLALLPWLARFGAASLPRRSAHATAVLRALAQASLHLHEGLVRAGLPTGFARRGTLSVFESARSLERARAGAPGASFLGAAEARALEPALAAGIARARLHPDDAHCDPGALVRALLDAAGRQGADVAHRGRAAPAAAERTGASRRSTRPRDGSPRARSCSPPARGRGRSRATPACTSRSRRPRAITSRSRRTRSAAASRSTWRRRG